MGQIAAQEPFGPTPPAQEKWTRVFSCLGRSGGVQGSVSSCYSCSVPYHWGACGCAASLPQVYHPGGLGPVGSMGSLEQVKVLPALPGGHVVQTLLQWCRHCSSCAGSERDSP